MRSTQKTPTQVWLTDEERRCLDACRRRQPGLPSRAEMIRRLIATSEAVEQPAG
jgi:hypothetical protein